MDKILNILAEETEGTCYASYRYCADEESQIPKLSYDESQPFSIVKNRLGETDSTLKTTKDLHAFSKKIIQDEPLFRYFLDGSRRTYKIDDIEINRRIFPIMTGQIGVACCERKWTRFGSMVWLNEINRKIHPVNKLYYLTIR